MNLGTLTTLEANFLGDPDQTRYSGKYTDSLNRANEQFALDTRALWKDTSWTHAADDADEDLPTDFMWEDWVTYDNKKLSPISRHRLNQEKSGEDWTDDTASLPTHFIIDPEQAVKEIVLYPIPSTAKTLRMRYFPLPTEMSSSTDVPLNSSSLMAQFHVGIAAYAAWLVLLYEQVTPEIIAKRNELLKIYQDSVTKAIDTFKNTASQPVRYRGTRAWT